ncbi:hypothetical protein H072_204 [Dactylellina haptotyla CBS 200.50]|uniref:Uncharacterized protein n=1 Tax=Dactylellina haptotyla (strain CBS 200.50) TaxID=1284197 RepID=S8ASD8_DACHA|nr:hypothetical protein H072_204 [Dactylellina haptotyla CBS 200.50]
MQLFGFMFASITWLAAMNLYLAQELEVSTVVETTLVTAVVTYTAPPDEPLPFQNHVQLDERAFPGKEEVEAGTYILRTSNGKIIYVSTSIGPISTTRNTRVMMREGNRVTLSTEAALTSTHREVEITVAPVPDSELV